MIKKALSGVFLLVIITGFIVQPAEGASQITMTIVYDNFIHTPGTMSDWGFACFITGAEKTILFDTGYQGHILMANIDSLKIDLDNLDLIVISHDHLDHTGGIDSVLIRNSDVLVYHGISFPESFSQNITGKGAVPVSVDTSVEICQQVFSTGEIQGVANEQSLILDTDSGLVVITGCAHTGIINILNKTKEVLNKDIYLVFGGFHLLNMSHAEIDQIIEEFKSLGVKKCGASHCTGDTAMALFKEAYGENYISMGTGQVITVSTNNVVSVSEEDHRKSLVEEPLMLEQNHPNPFNPVTIINYQLPITSEIELSIYNLLGQKVTTLVSARQPAGIYSVKWNATGLASGVYFYRLQTEGFHYYKKCLLVR